MRYCRCKDDIHQSGTEQGNFTGNCSREDEPPPAPLFWVKKVKGGRMKGSGFGVRGSPKLRFFSVDKYLGPLHEPAGDFLNNFFARSLAVTEGHERIPERGATYREPRETGYFCRNRQPFDDFGFI